MNIISAGHDAKGVVTDILEDYEHIPPEGLIEIIPQIVSGLDISDKLILLEIMKKLLIHIGVAHLQAIILPLMFCQKSENLINIKATDEIFLSKLQKKFRSLYQKLYEKNCVS